MDKSSSVIRFEVDGNSRLVRKLPLLRWAGRSFSLTTATRQLENELEESIAIDKLLLSGVVQEVYAASTLYDHQFCMRGIYRQLAVREQF